MREEGDRGVPEFDVSDHVTRPLDTTHDAADRQRDAIRRMTPALRLELALSMSDDVRRLAEAGIRSRHPEYSDQRVMEALSDVLLGPELAEAARHQRPRSR